jgi:hypothetical protein
MAAEKSLMEVLHDLLLTTKPPDHEENCFPVLWWLEWLIFIVLVQPLKTGHDV